jgi:hypothetical protein
VALGDGRRDSGWIVSDEVRDAEMQLGRKGISFLTSCSDRLAPVDYCRPSAIGGDVSPKQFVLQHGTKAKKFERKSRGRKQE